MPNPKRKETSSQQTKRLECELSDWSSLAQSSVYSINQDAKGFIWLGTASGLSRFDGEKIINYITEDGLADGAVKAIYIDTVGAVWLGHMDGGNFKNL